MRRDITVGRLGQLASDAGLYLDRLHSSRVRTGELFAERLVSAGLASWEHINFDPNRQRLEIPGGAPETHEQVRELYAALKATERMRQDDDSRPLASGQQLDSLASDYSMIRVLGETDADLRARLMALLSARLTTRLRA